MVAMDIVNLYENYNNYFNKEFKSIFTLCSKAAARNNYKLYLIGGIVRDLLLDIKNFDIDITVEGDAIEFARILENENIAKILSVHKPFGTVKVEIMGTKIDFASTRSESYPKKGHLPHVDKIGCPLELDVVRRDFTINALALSINEGSFGDLIDYTGGFDDLQSKKLKILHEGSFIDDPTRIIRGLKFATRLGFEIETKTLELQRKYLNNINYDMGNKRVKSELKQTFNLNSQFAFDKFLDEKIYKLITKLELKKPEKNVEEVVKKYKVKHPWIVYIGLIGAYEKDEFLDKLELTKAEKEIVVDAKNLLASNFTDDDFEIYKNFGNCKVESLLIFAILGDEKAEEKVYRYLDVLKKVKLLINGSDLLELGIQPSKKYGEIFDNVLRTKISNPKMTKTEEINLVKTYM